MSSASLHHRYLAFQIFGLGFAVRVKLSMLLNFLDGRSLVDTFLGKGLDLVFGKYVGLEGDWDWDWGLCGSICSESKAS